MVSVEFERVTKPLRAVGEFFAMSLDTLVAMFKLPFPWREFLLQSWFVARVSLIPTLLLTIPFTVLVSFTLNILLRELGAADLSGAGAAFGAVTQVGPMVTVYRVTTDLPAFTTLSSENTEPAEVPERTMDQLRSTYSCIEARIHQVA